MTRRPQLELAIQDTAGVRVAVELGLDRAELCSALGLGGVTPSLAAVEAAVEAAGVGGAASSPAGRSTGVPRHRGGVGVHVLVRPRPGDFRYAADEVAVMVADVRHAVAAGAAGVVVGALDDDGLPDLGVLARLREAAAEAEVTFHRALDQTADPLHALDLVAGAGVTRVLTSGGRPTAAEGVDVLRRMVEVAGGRCQVMAGSGIAAANVADVVATGVDAVHFSARRKVPGHGIPLGASDDGSHDRTDADLAAQVVAALGANT